MWLKDPSQANAAANVLNGLKETNPQTAIDTVYSGDNLTQAGFGNSSNRTPDLIVKLQPGYVLVGNPATSTKRSEHGGLSEDDTPVCCMANSCTDQKIKAQALRPYSRLFLAINN